MNRLLFFAELQEQMGAEQLELQAEGQTIEELKGYIGDTYQLHKVKEAMVAVNEEFAVNDYQIQDHDVIAFIPPVSGG
ncbi:molybdopterin converting factor subunit 1 [Halobacillus litoralis]|uniref:molybdopterin converting factor subunit 1 n=1 Tax=Halobacillus litoralis TaxID=45668 RepID=UPI001CD68572|nr:molybdopterin converting factor subunit 1 [Halobacillus litoralis]MCA0969604.1 molybdopterin converting factor subunit 1 [Halobacillus litoralis]